MPDVVRRGARVALVLAALLAGPAWSAAPETRSEADLLRAMRIAVLDGDSDEVLRLARDYLDAYPGGEDALRVRLYRAQALADRPDRRGEAIDAFQEVIPDVDDPILLEDAWIRLLRLASDEAASGSPRGVRILSAALDRTDVSVVALAGIRAANLAGPPELRRKALDRLVEVHPRLEEELADEALLAIIKIDPTRAPRDAPARGSGKRMIHLRLENRCQGKEPVVQIAVNLPLSFATAVLDALGDDIRQEVTEGLKEEGIDLQGLVDSVKELDEGSALELAVDECATVRLWID